MTDPTPHADCPGIIKREMTKLGVDVTVSTAPPLIQGPYEQAGFVCPHGTTYWLEPTSEQIARWARDGVR